MKKIMTGILSLVLMLNLTGCGKSSTKTSAEPSKELVVVDWGGNYTDVSKKARYEPFEKKYNVTIKVVSPTDYGKFKAMVQSGNVEWDVVNVDADFAIRGVKNNLFEKLDYNVIKTDGVDKKFISDYGIASETFAVAISYNTDKFSESNHPKTWKDVWDTKKFPGARSFQKFAEGTLEAALLADGVEPDKLFPLDVDRAFASLDKIKPSVKSWWSAGAQAPQLLASGELSVAAAWSGRVLAAKTQGSPENVEYNQALIYADSWVVAKGSPNKDLAMKFINFCTTAETQAEFSKLVDYAPTNANALPLLSEELKTRLGQSTQSAKQIVADVKWWADNYDAVDERFQKWLLK
ncbi:ABC transporter substrate-binding protein [Clostridium lacusfryxellense]|uniref:ABC transporter substrate-binding protein n=1 Tax=Clostridium lacusfryxellense TaxID=205328 RepID=UPI001C0E0B9B|nr:ABC transporter substrate-binding protein [Clostridium lacusfryxellense]MBU3113229.1 ABC transporter substrate-binding protein [Clostridium lacusfryxellense]